MHDKNDVLEKDSGGHLIKPKPTKHWSRLLVLKGILVEYIVLEFLAINHGNMKECCTMQGIGSTGCCWGQNLWCDPQRIAVYLLVGGGMTSGHQPCSVAACMKDNSILLSLGRKLKIMHTVQDSSHEHPNGHGCSSGCMFQQSLQEVIGLMLSVKQCSWSP